MAAIIGDEQRFGAFVMCCLGFQFHLSEKRIHLIPSAILQESDVFVRDAQVFEGFSHYFYVYNDIFDVTIWGLAVLLVIEHNHDDHLGSELDLLRFAVMFRIRHHLMIKSDNCLYK